jgi:large subunit ribosomal protein L48
MIFPY